MNAFCLALFCFGWASAQTVARLFAESDDPNTRADSTPLVVGVRFASEVRGHVVALRYHRQTGNNGVGLLLLGTGRYLSLWALNGTRLAQVRQSDGLLGAPLGWNHVPLDARIPIEANVVYVASVETPTGGASVTPNFFPNSVRRAGWPLYTSGYAGVVTSTQDFPNTTTSGDNFWIDVDFETNETRPTSAAVGPSTTRTSTTTVSTTTTNVATNVATTAATTTAAANATPTSNSSPSIATSSSASSSTSSASPTTTTSSSSSIASAPTTTTSSSSALPTPTALPDWVIPVAAGVGGCLVLSLLILVVVLLVRRRRERRGQQGDEMVTARAEPPESEYTAAPTTLMAGGGSYMIVPPPGLSQSGSAASMRSQNIVASGYGSVTSGEYDKVSQTGGIGGYTKVSGVPLPAGNNGYASAAGILPPGGSSRGSIAARDYDVVLDPDADEERDVLGSLKGSAQPTSGLASYTYSRGRRHSRSSSGNNSEADGEELARGHHQSHHRRRSTSRDPVNRLRRHRSSSPMAGQH